MDQFVTVVAQMILVITAVVVVLQIFDSMSHGALEHKYSKKPILTDNEKEFFGWLIEALPDFHVFPQVSMGAVLQPAVGSQNKRHYHRMHRSISHKVVDYVVCDNAMNIVALIEHDDRAYSTVKVGRRDAITTQAGYVVLRYRSKKQHTAGLIAKMISSMKVAS